MYGAFIVILLTLDSFVLVTEVLFPVDSPFHVLLVRIGQLASK